MSVAIAFIVKSRYLFLSSYILVYIRLEWKDMVSSGIVIEEYMSVYLIDISGMVLEYFLNF
jgi:hypothetical protein